MDEYIDVFKGDRDIRHVLDRYAADQVDVVIDMPTSFLFEHFHSRWPDAKVGGGDSGGGVSGGVSVVLVVLVWC